MYIGQTNILVACTILKIHVIKTRKCCGDTLPLHHGGTPYMEQYYYISVLVLLPQWMSKALHRLKNKTIQLSVYMSFSFFFLQIQCSPVSPAQTSNPVYSLSHHQPCFQDQILTLTKFLSEPIINYRLENKNTPFESSLTDQLTE